MRTPTELPTAPVSPRPTGSGRTDRTAVGLDALGILAFILVGRSSHDEGSVVLGTLTTAWPFLAGAGLGWLALIGLRAGGRDWAGASIPAGATVLGSTLVGGMLLRRFSGTGGTPVSFVAVAATFLTVALLGWRAAARVRARRV